MTCTHQWHDATTKAGPEWVCAHCKVKYSDTKKAPSTKREWVGLDLAEMDVIIDGNMAITDSKLRDAVYAVVMDTVATLKGKNHG
jgi:hypothetical protein